MALEQGEIFEIALDERSDESGKRLRIQRIGDQLIIDGDASLVYPYPLSPVGIQNPNQQYQ